MGHLALGWACTFKELFVRFPYEKCKFLMKKYKQTLDRKLKVRKVFIDGVNIILKDIIDNNNTFKCPSIGYQGGELHMEPVTNEEFMRVRAKGKFAGIDFIETLFTGYLLYLYVHGKRDNFLHRRKFPVYLGGQLKKDLIENINNGKTYC